MKDHQLQINYHEYFSVDELSEKNQQLVREAQAAMENAYAVYSQFKVGAAVFLENGKIITGSNQENAAFPSGLCAERVALFYANAQYPDVPVKTLVIIAGQNNVITLEPATPCGSCRQVMLETEYRFKTPITVIMVGKDKILSFSSVKDLLPLSFDQELLSK